MEVVDANNGYQTTTVHLQRNTERQMTSLCPAGKHLSDLHFNNNQKVAPKWHARMHDLSTCHRLPNDQRMPCYWLGDKEMSALSEKTKWNE